MSSEPLHKGEKLAVRVRRVVERHGAESLHATVFCPSQARTVATDECKTCQWYKGIRVDPTERDSFLLCSNPAAPVGESHPPPAKVGRPEQGILAQALQAPVGSIMVRGVLCVMPEVTLDELILVLVEQGISGVPVVDRDGKPVGLVSKTDLLWESYEEAEVRTEGIHLASSANGQNGSHAKPSRSVAEIMTTNPISVSESATIAEAAATMTLNGVHRLLVVDENGAVVGILSVGDLTAWLARQAGYIVPRHFPKRK